MPELPEVETVCRGLEKAMLGQKIARITLHRANLRIPFPKDLARISDEKVTGITRRAKYILINLKSGRTMIVHLGMSGRMTIHAKNNTPRRTTHDHMVMTLGNGTTVIFNDPRRFGLVDLFDTAKIALHRFFKHLGPEPLDTEFTSAYLAKKLHNKKTAIKVAIMDQRVVVGVGNIYASEALFESGIDPKRKAGSLTPAEIKKLIAAIRKVLNKAIKAGGSSLRDYVQADGELGYFQHSFAVYDRAGEKCRSCKTAVEKSGGIAQLTQGGRSTFYCPVCQK